MRDDTVLYGMCLGLRLAYDSLENRCLGRMVIT